MLSGAQRYHCISFILDFLPPPSRLLHQSLYLLHQQRINSRYNDTNVPWWARNDEAYHSLSIRRLVRVSQYYLPIILYINTREKTLIYKTPV